MKTRIYLYFLILAGIILSCQEEPRYQSFTPGEIWLDNNNKHINAHGGGILYHNGVYYWFGEHKIEGEAGNKAHVGVHCYSSKDLYNWKDEGIALSVDPNGSKTSIEKGCVLERPKVIYNAKNNNFVMWFHLELKNNGYRAAQSGVAISDKPTGPYKFLYAKRMDACYWPLNASEAMKQGESKAKSAYRGGGFPEHPDSINLIKRDLEGGQMARDMNLFVDDDGRAYHIFASEENSTLHIALLNDDYTEHTGIYTRHFTARFMEAPVMFKHEGKYYLMMSGCTGWAPNAARSAVADSILGNWKELGNPCVDEDANTTYHSQSTYILPMPGHKGQYIYMGDRWNPKNAIDGRYIWLPLTFKDGRFLIHWKKDWKIEE